MVAQCGQKGIPDHVLPDHACWHDCHNITAVPSCSIGFTCCTSCCLICKLDLLDYTHKMLDTPFVHIFGVLPVYAEVWYVHQSGRLTS